ncbi:MAG: NAD(P)/FAD-dependent oxidoreductase [Candidatus Acidiferrales bacterium]
MADVLIAGGGIAGSSLAIMLGRKGVNAELFERARFPREKPCGEGLMPAGVAVLDRLGLTDSIGGRPFDGVRYHFDGRVLEGRFSKVPGLPHAGIGQRRKVIDEVLCSKAAATSGIRVRTGTLVEGPIIENERVVGLTVEGKAIRAPLVVAADGMRSAIRQQLGWNAPVRRRRFGIRAHFRLTARKPQTPWVEIFIGKQYEIYVTPLPHREIAVIILSEIGRAAKYSGKAFLRQCRAFPALASRLEGAEQISKPMGASPLSGGARSGVGPGVVLLGDAAGFSDPITGGGMAQALQSAELLAEYIVQRPRMDNECLEAFDLDRKALLRDHHRLTTLALWFSEHARVGKGVLSLPMLSRKVFLHFVGVAGGLKPLLFANHRMLMANYALKGAAKP